LPNRTHSGRQAEFYWDIQYGGESMRLHPGHYNYVGDHWNDQISSFRCVHLTD
jgi:hypothetical protein